MSYSACDFQDDVIRQLYNAGLLVDPSDSADELDEDDDEDGPLSPAAAVKAIDRLLDIHAAVQRFLTTDPAQDSPEVAALRATVTAA